MGPRITRIDAKSAFAALRLPRRNRSFISCVSWAMRRWALEVGRWTFSTLGKANVLARIHLEVQVQRIFCVRLDHFLHEFHENGVFAKDCVLVHRLKIDGNEE